MSVGPEHKDILRVQDIILDESHPRYRECGGPDSIGTILYTHIDEPTPENLSQCDTAKPLHTSIAIYPIAGEIVYRMYAPASNYNMTGKLISYYLAPHSILRDPNNNSLPNALDHDDKFYQGQYFKENETIRPLRPFEGDLIIEGRFGNSIRFGSTTDITKHNKFNRWSTGGKIGDPITIIRNGQFRNPDKPPYEGIVETLKADHSSIYLCSNQQMWGFTPASLHNDSYGDKEAEENTKEPSHSRDSFPENLEEDVSLNTPNPLPAQELQNSNGLQNIQNTNIAQYDISETENQAISINDNVVLPTNYIIPANLSSTFLNEQIG